MSVTACPLPPGSATGPATGALAAVPITHLLYLHGFRSSPRSAKARRLAGLLARSHPAVHWWCPQLPPSPRVALALALAGTEGWPAATSAVIGSSLGGFYADRVAGRLGCRAVLLNPAVAPARDLAGHIGELTAWHDPGQRLFFAPEYVDELRAIAELPRADPARVLAIVARGDEVLDWSEMAAHHAAARLHVLDGGDHGLSDFDPLLPLLLAFLGLAPAPG